MTEGGKPLDLVPGSSNTCAIFTNPRHQFLMTPEPFPEPLDLSQTNTTFFPPPQKQLPPLSSSQ